MFFEYSPIRNKYQRDKKGDHQNSLRHFGSTTNTSRYRIKFKIAHSSQQLNNSTTQQQQQKSTATTYLSHETETKCDQRLAIFLSPLFPTTHKTLLKKKSSSLHTLHLSLVQRNTMLHNSRFKHASRRNRQVHQRDRKENKKKGNNACYCIYSKFGRLKAALRLSNLGELQSKHKKQKKKRKIKKRGKRNFKR